VSGFGAAADRPNIVFILADDVRWDDLGATGHPFSKTPNIDRVFVAAQPAAETDDNVEEQKTADGNDQNEQPRRRRRRYPSAAGGNGSSRASGNGNDDGATERTGQAAIAEAQSPGEATA
jgi:hypothetical protein